MTIADNIIARLYSRPEWMATAPCAGMTADYFKEGRGGENQAQRKAKERCQECPHRVRCLEYALDNEEQYGVWGGLSVRERQAVSARRRSMGWTTGALRNVPRPA